MQTYDFSLKTQAAKPLPTSQVFYQILCTINRRNELYRLVTWAKRKKHAGVSRAYWNLAVAEEKKIMRYFQDYPYFTRVAYRMHQLTQVLFPLPKYYPVGAARGYKRHHRA